MNGCTSQISDVSPHSEEVSDQQKTASHVRDDVPEFPDDYMDISEQYHVINIPSMFSNFREDDFHGNTKVKKMNATDVYENTAATDEFEFNCASEVYDPGVDDYSSAPDIYNMGRFNPYDYNRVVVLTETIFRYDDDAKREDFLENTGGEEELRQSLYKLFRSRYDDDQS